MQKKARTMTRNHNARAAVIAAALTVGVTSQAAAQESSEGDLILNEFNAVGPTKYLEDSESDSFFGRVQGNGGEWMEMVVITDHLDIRGWTVEWENDDPDDGTVTFTNDTLWSDLRAGTIITIREGGAGETDTSFDCNTGDFWIRIGADDTDYVTQTGHSFKTDNDGWQARILDDDTTPQVVQGWVGEGTTAWAGSGVNSEEVGKLEEDPSDSPSNYQDGNCSTFGSPNGWNDCASTQDFDSLRTWCM